jgi:hypothetical protein
MLFVVMYLVFQGLERRPYTSTEAVLNGLDALKAAKLSQLSTAHRHDVLTLLQARADQDDPFTVSVVAMLRDASVLPAHRPGPAARAAHRFREAYLRWSDRRSFVAIVSMLFLALAVGWIAAGAAIRLDGGSFGRQVTFFSALSASLLVIIGVVELHRSGSDALRWFDRALLVMIFVGQTFAFAELQLLGVVGIAVALVAWGLLRSAMRAQRERDAHPAE